MIKRWARTQITRWITSSTRLKLRRLAYGARRRITRAPLVAHYFHRVDDPYAQLMVQAVPELMDRFGLKVIPHVVERLPAVMYPDPARYEALSVLDAFRLARLYGLGLPSEATVPDRLSVQMCARYLASITDKDSFFSQAEELGSLLWRRDARAIQQRCAVAQMDDEPLREAERLLSKLGQYTSGSLYFEGEFYPGLDRLDHLEARLSKIVGTTSRPRFDATRRWRETLAAGPSIAGKSIEFFFSVRSPYSYLAINELIELRRISDVQIRLRPVLPMLMRGMAVTQTKGLYIVFDVAREARLKAIPFGSLAEVGEPIRRAMAVGMAIADVDQQLTFYESFMRSTWAEGKTGLEPATMARALKAADIAPGDITPLAPAAWEAQEDRNRSDMLRIGGWGVPTFYAGGQTFWGQDRLWAVIEALQAQ